MSILRVRSALLVALAALVLAGCGLFGDDDQSASADGPAPVVTSVRVESGDRWFDIDPAMIQIDDSGGPSGQTLALLTEEVDNLSLTLPEATDAGISFEGNAFGVIASIPGSEPDINALALQIRDAVEAGNTAVEVPFADVPAAVDEDAASEYAAELNERLGDGIDVSIDGQRAVLSAKALGSATTVSWRADAWDVSIDYDQLDAELARLFPNVGQEGGEASFTIEEAEEGGDPGTVVIIPGTPETVCCDEASARRIEQALTSDVEVATLLFREVDGEFGTAWAEELGIEERVATFTTNYTPGQSRVTNIRLIADLTQGVILMPGETFSLNEHVGQRTRDKGFVPAGTIVNGHLVDSVGGGISQFATTLFNAAFFGGLEFEAYQSHSIYFSRYPYGREATISWPAPALIIENPSPYPILIWPTSTAGSVTVDLYSTPWVEAEQSGQWEGGVGVACTRVTTERTRTFIEDGTTDVDTVFAIYRPEGIACNGEATEDPDAEQIEALENGEDPGFENGDPILDPETGEPLLDPETGEPLFQEATGDGVPPEEQPTQTPPADGDADPETGPVDGGEAPTEPAETPDPDPAETPDPAPETESPEEPAPEAPPETTPPEPEPAEDPAPEPPPATTPPEEPEATPEGETADA